MNHTRRRFLRRISQSAWGIGAATFLSDSYSPCFAAPVIEKPLQVCLLSGSEEYKSNVSLASYQKELEKDHPIQCSRAFWTSKNDLPGLEALDTCDVMLLFTRRLELPNDQLDRIKKYCLSGRPIVGVRTASHAFENWLELDRKVFGGDYSGHYAAGLETHVKAAVDASKHPILDGFTPFKTRSKLYKNPHLADDATVLLTGTIPEHTEPIAWTRRFRKGRMFYTSLGSPEDFQRQVFRTMLTNALFWSTGRKRTSIE